LGVPTPASNSRRGAFARNVEILLASLTTKACSFDWHACIGKDRFIGCVSGRGSLFRPRMASGVANGTEERSATAYAMTNLVPRLFPKSLGTRLRNDLQRTVRYVNDTHPFSKLPKSCSLLRKRIL
jgi:hypothetical protein